MFRLEFRLNWKPLESFRSNIFFFPFSLRSVHAKQKERYYLAWKLDLDRSFCDLERIRIRATFSKGKCEGKKDTKIILSYSRFERRFEDSLSNSSTRFDVKRNERSTNVCMPNVLEIVDVTRSEGVAIQLEIPSQWRRLEKRKLRNKNWGV